MSEVPGQSITLKAGDGLELGATLYLPAAAGEARRAVLIAPATAVRRAYYDGYARYLSGRGFTVLTLDYRGIGASRPARLRGFQASMHQWGEQDLAGALAWLHSRFPSHRLLAVGHSAGGQLLGLAANNGLLHGLVTVAAQSGYWGLWPRPRRYAMALLWHVAMPGLSHALGYFPASVLRLGEDLPAGVALEWARWCRDPDFLAGRSRRESVRHFGSLAAPILAYSFSDDPFAPRAAVDWLTDLYRSAPRQRRHLSPGQVGQPIQHFGFFRERLKEPLWSQSAAWLLGR